jgi:hypothetical protein
MATTFGFLLPTIFACTTDAATAGIVDETWSSRYRNFGIQGSLAEIWAGFWGILATREQFIIG